LLIESTNHVVQLNDDQVGANKGSQYNEVNHTNLKTLVVWLKKTRTWGPHQIEEVSKSINLIKIEEVSSPLSFPYSSKNNVCGV